MKLPASSDVIRPAQTFAADACLADAELAALLRLRALKIAAPLLAGG